MKKYIEHNSSIFNINSKQLSISLYIIPIFINLLPTVNYMGWIYPIIVFYLEKTSPFTKFHALNSLVLELTRVAWGLLLIVFAVAFKIPIYTIADNNSAVIGLLGYIDLLFIGTTFYFSLFSIYKCLKYEEAKLFVLYYFTNKYLQNNDVHGKEKFLFKE